MEMDSQAKLKNQTYHIELIPTPMIVYGDEFQLHEAVINFISNAIKYTPNNGRITIQLKQENQRAVFTVEDNGYGIPANLQNQLFQPFYRAATKETVDIEGTGLGLHIVKTIVERHSGNILFHSVYGKGSTFGFELSIQ